MKPLRNLLAKGRRDERGFTLIELLVVVAIIGILVTIAAPRLISAVDGAKGRKAEADIRIVENALERFHTDHGVYPIRLGVLVDEKYLKKDSALKNSFGQYYFYAVKYDDDNSDSLKNYKAYVLADPGQYPSSYSSGDASAETQPPAGKNPTLTAWYWGSTAPGGVVTQTIGSNSYTVTLARYDDGDTRPSSLWGSYTGKVVTEE